MSLEPGEWKGKASGDACTAVQALQSTETAVTVAMHI